MNLTRRLLSVLSTAAAAILLLPSSSASAQPHRVAHAAPRAQTRSGAPAGKPTGAQILKLTQQMLAAAPKRYLGSPGHIAAENFIKSHFAPEQASGNLVVDEFTATTSLGHFPMRNIIVKFPGKKDGIIVLATHYETNFWLKDTAFVGANDGACTSALLIALGQYFRTHPPQGYSIWLLFDDGEESMKAQWNDNDALFGTRHAAAKWSADGTLGKIKAFVLADMIGDKDLNIDRDSNSTPWLEDLLLQAAHETNHTANVFKNTTQVDDDHIPFVKRGVPSLDVIDIDYGPQSPQHPEGYHHTPQDTIDKLSAQSLQTSADLFLAVIRLIDQR